MAITPIKLVTPIRMKKSLILTLSIALLAITSCKKIDRSDDPEPTLPENRCYLTTSSLVSEDDQDVLNFSYDNQGRVSLVKSATGLDISYTYTSTKIIAMIKESSGSEGLPFEYILDAKGRIISESSLFGSKTEYRYNAEGYLIESDEIVDPSTTYTTKYSYTNGDLTKIEEDGDETIITYGTELAFPNYMVNANLDFPVNLLGPLKNYFGKQSVHLFTKIESSRSLTYDTFTYVKDINGNVTKTTGISVPADPFRAFTATATYTCR